MWGIETIRRARAYRRAESGSALVSFALLMPALVAITVATIDFGLLLLDYHRAGEAARRIARIAAIRPPVADLSGFTAGSVITCRASATGPSCDGAPLGAAATMDEIVSAARDVLPRLEPENVEVTYREAGLGDASMPGGLLPVVTVRIVGLQHAYLLMGGIPGLPDSVTFLPFTTSQVAGGHTGT